MNDFKSEQIELCKKYNVEFQPIDYGLRIGISDNFFFDILPFNGLRHPPEYDMCGWYLWAGEQFSEDKDFFKSLHLYHLAERRPDLMKFLALPAGWRFLVANDFEDVWFDKSLLNI